MGEGRFRDTARCGDGLRLEAVFVSSILESLRVSALLFRPYFNMSIMEDMGDGPSPQAGVNTLLAPRRSVPRSETNELAIYPYRVVGDELRIEFVVQKTRHAG